MYVATLSTGDFSVSDETISELEIKRQPTQLDLKETTELMNDFQIHIEIPAFLTLSQLYRWRSDIIDKALI